MEKKKKKLKVLIDMDDTIENLLEAWVAYLNNHHGTSVNYKNIKDWDITLYFPSLIKSQVFYPLYTRDFWETVKPKQDAVYYIDKLWNEGFDLYLVTASHYETLKYKFEKALFPYFPVFDEKHIIVTSNKQMLRGDVLIDDGIHNLVGGKYKKILYTRPYNEDYDAEKHGMIRVNDWKTIYQVLKEMESVKNNEK